MSSVELYNHLYVGSEMYPAFFHLLNKSRKASYKFFSRIFSKNDICVRCPSTYPPYLLEVTVFIQRDGNITLIYFRDY